MNKCGKLRWKLVDSKGRTISRHFTKKNAERAQILSGRVKVYVRKC